MCKSDYLAIRIPNKEQIVPLTEASWSGDGLVGLISFPSLTDGQNLDMIFSPGV